MRYFLTESSRRIVRGSGRINHVFGARYKWSWLPGSYELAYVYKYILRSPVRAGIVEAVEDYRYSTLRYLIEGRTQIALSEGLQWKQLPQGWAERRVWLNQPTPKEKESLVKLAVRRSTFAFSRDRKVALRVKKLDREYLPIGV